MSTHQPYWNVTLYHGQAASIMSPLYKAEHEARKAFHNPLLFAPAPLPASYAVVLWECKKAGEQSALTSNTVSLPGTVPEAFSITR